PFCSWCFVVISQTHQDSAPGNIALELTNSSSTWQPQNASDRPATPTPAGRQWIKKTLGWNGDPNTCS
ncbi:hypothetical protein STEG23_003406, partial [Scotinomys teguina]